MAGKSYSIGQVSKLLGLSVEGIRNYEKAGIIQSRRREESNYRSYSYLDITSLVRARMYRALGFSLSETEALTNDRSIEELSAALRDRREDIVREQRLLTAKLSLLKELEEETAALESRLGLVELRNVPAYFRIEFARDGVIDFSEGTVAVVRRWMDCAPFVHVSTRYSGEHVYGGFAIRAEYASLFDIREDTSAVRLLPPSLCLRTTVREENNGHSDVACLQQLRDFAAYHRFRISEDAIGHTLAGVHKQSGYQRFRQVDARIAF